MKRQRKIYICIPDTVSEPLARLRAEKVQREISRVNDIPTTGSAMSTLGEQIDEMLASDVVFLLRGWQKSKNCLALFEVANVYGKEVMLE